MEPLSASRSFLLVLDFQERLLPAMDQQEALLHRSSLLVRGAEVLGLPALVTEQYPRGLGPTHAALKSLLAHRDPAPVPIEKLAFSCLGEAAFTTALESLDRPQVIITGMETHVCVYQTVRDLLAAGYLPVLPADALGSRSSRDKAVALERMARMGAVVTSVEAVLFELLERAGTAAFKEVSALVKEGGLW